MRINWTSWINVVVQDTRLSGQFDESVQARFWKRMTLYKNLSASFVLLSCKANNDTYPKMVLIINAVLGGLLSVPIIVCNLVVLVAIWKTSSLRTPSNLLICALASTDCCVGVFQPLYVTILCSYFKEIMPTSAKCVLLKINKYLATLFAQMSFLIFTAISVDKLVMLSYSLSYSTTVTNRRVYLVLGFLLILSTILSFLNISHLETYGVIVVLLDLICITISLLSYVKTYRTVMRHQREIHNQTCAVAPELDKDKKLLDLDRFKKRTQSMMVLYSTFLLSYLPFLVVVVLIGTKGSRWELEAAMVCTATIVFLNSLLNPLLICWTLKDIRNAVLSLFLAVQREH